MSAVYTSFSGSFQWDNQSIHSRREKEVHRRQEQLATSRHTHTASLATASRPVIVSTSICVCILMSPRERKEMRVKAREKEPYTHTYTAISIWILMAWSSVKVTYGHRLRHQWPANCAGNSEDISSYTQLRTHKFYPNWLSWANTNYPIITNKDIQHFLSCHRSPLAFVSNLSVW